MNICANRHTITLALLLPWLHQNPSCCFRSQQSMGNSFRWINGGRNRTGRRRHAKAHNVTFSIHQLQHPSPIVSARGERDLTRQRRHISRPHIPPSPILTINNPIPNLPLLRPHRHRIHLIRPLRRHLLPLQQIIRIQPRTIQ